MTLKIVTLDSIWNPLLNELGCAVRIEEGIDLPVYSLSKDQKFPKARFEISANHLAFATSDIEGLTKVWTEKLGEEPLFEAKNVLDPILNDYIDMVHFYKRSQFYVTLIDDKNAGFQDYNHFGFEVGSNEELKVIQGVLEKNLKYEIDWVGDITGSRVVHYTGPDNRTHDFFVPNLQS